MGGALQIMRAEGSESRGRRLVRRLRSTATAGKAFLRYPRSGGQKRSPLPDFYIGAHTAVAGYRLLTRDASRYGAYFPTVHIIAPVTGD